MTLEKNFKFQRGEIKQIAVGFGSCVASNMITVHGRLVGYMYRGEPFHETDSGWRFFSGEESQEYADDPSNFAIYDINTIANYDPEIAQFIESEIGCFFERDSSGKFVKVEE